MQVLSFRLANAVPARLAERITASFVNTSYINPDIRWTPCCWKETVSDIHYEVSYENWL